MYKILMKKTEQTKKGNRWIERKDEKDLTAFIYDFSCKVCEF